MGRREEQSGKRTPGEGEVVIEEGLIIWEDVAPLSIWVNSFKSVAAVKPHYSAQHKHVGASHMLQGHRALRQGQRFQERKHRCSYHLNHSTAGEKRGCDEPVARKRP